ncbi:MAG: hypothetical protein RM338_19010 [Nostoc sp. DedQUE12a]|nr:hypothetical protein [Nostoc sp. DedQUE12a]
MYCVETIWRELDIQNYGIYESTKIDRRNIGYSFLSVGTSLKVYWVDREAIATILNLQRIHLFHRQSSYSR